MGMVSVGFLLFILFTSNRSHARCRTSRLKGAILTRCSGSGADLPSASALYGVRGVLVAFAFAIASLLSGRLDSTYAVLLVRGRWRRGSS